MNSMKVNLIVIHFKSILIQNYCNFIVRIFEECITWAPFKVWQFIQWKHLHYILRNKYIVVMDQEL